MWCDTAWYDTLFALTDVRGILRNVSSAEAHAETHVRRLEGRGVVRTIPGGSHNLTPIGAAGNPLQTKQDGEGAGKKTQGREEINK